VRDILKELANGLAGLVVGPRVLAFRISAWILGADRALEGATQSLARVPGLRGQYLRRAFLSRVGVQCHRSATVCFGTVFSKMGAVIDEHVYIGPTCYIGLAHLERDVLLGPCVHVPSGAHVHGTEDPAIPIRTQPMQPRVVRIGAGTWVGSAAVVLADVGTNCVIGAGAVVTRPIPDNSVAAGVPARVIQERFTQLPSRRATN
jgi:virginiamycin A acetyltransferase